MKIKFIQFIIFLIPAMALAGFVLAYDHSVIHPALTCAAVEVYNREVDDQITDEQKEWITRGATDEDHHPRYVNHFYDPVSKKGIGILNGQPAKEWAQKQDVWEDFSVPAILKDYSEGRTARAYQGIGHILHLIEDMSVPAHTRLDAHEEGDSYESWAKNHAGLDSAKIAHIPIDNIDEAFDRLAGYSHNYFFSKDTIVDIEDRIIKEEIIKIGQDEYVYVYCKDEYDQEFICAKKVKHLNFNEYKIDNEDFKLHQDYWRLLHPQAVGYASGVLEWFMNEFARLNGEKTEKISKWSVFWGALTRHSTYVVNNTLSAAINTVFNTYNEVTETVNEVKDFSGLVIESAEEEVEEVVDDIRGGIESIRVLGEDYEDTGDDAISTSTSVESSGETQPEGLPEEETINSNENEITTSSSTPPSNSADRHNDIEVKYVIDGDTFILDTDEKVRLIGIDTPELDHDSEDSECLAEWARLRTEQMLNSGDLTLVKDPGMEEDKYGRLLRYAYADELFINERLAFEGLAEIFFCEPYFKNCPVAEDMERKSIIIKANMEAQEKKRGIYSSFCNDLESEGLLLDQYGRLPFVYYGSGGSQITSATSTPSINSGQATSTSSVQATSTPQVGTSTPQVGTSTPSVASSTPQIGTSTSSVQATSTPGIATSTIDTATSTDDQATSTDSVQATSTLQVLDHIVISEVLAHGPGGKSDEFVELYNPTDEIIDVRGYKLQYSAYDSENFRKKISLGAPRTVIYPQEHYLISSSLFDDTVPDSRKSTYLGLADEGGNIRIIDSEEKVIDLVAYGTGEYGEGRAAVSNFPDLYSIVRGDYDTDDNLTDFYVQQVPDPQEQLFTHLKHQWDFDQSSGEIVLDTISGNGITLINPIWNINSINDYGDFEQGVYLTNSLQIEEDKAIEVSIDIDTEYGFSLAFWYFTSSSSDANISISLQNDDEDVEVNTQIFSNKFNFIVGDNDFDVIRDSFGKWNLCILTYDRYFNAIYYFAADTGIDGRSGVLVKELANVDLRKLKISTENDGFALNRLRIFDLPMNTEDMYIIYRNDMNQKHYNSY